MQVGHSPQGPIQSSHQQQRFYPSQLVHGSSPSAITHSTYSCFTPLHSPISPAPLTISQQLPTSQTFYRPLPPNSYPTLCVNSRGAIQNLTAPPSVAMYGNHQPYHSTDERPNPGAPSFQPRPPMYPNPHMSLPYAAVVSGAAQRAPPNGPPPPQPWQADVYAPAFVPSFYMVKTCSMQSCRSRITNVWRDRT